MQKPIRALFFDIGNTLGSVDVPSKTLTPFPFIPSLLESAREVFRIPIGIISNTPTDWTTADVKTMLDRAGLLQFLDPAAIITSTAAGASKPAPQIFQFAATHLGVTTAECFFIDDEIVNVTGARRAGMSALHKPTP
jgi:FMN phosphatase YigB (HAD superfamily)